MRDRPLGNAESIVRLPSEIYHLAETENWSSIWRSGLLSASRLLETSGLPAHEQIRLSGTHRRGRMVLPNGVAIRDQKPMPPDALERCLIGLSAGEWYALVNSRVFFWFDRERLNRQRGACEPHRQVV